MYTRGEINTTIVRSVGLKTTKELEKIIGVDSPEIPLARLPSEIDDQVIVNNKRYKIILTYEKGTYFQVDTNSQTLYVNNMPVQSSIDGLRHQYSSN